MKVNISILYLALAGMFISISPLGAVSPELSLGQEEGVKKERKETKVRGRINQEDYKPGKKAMEMDGLSLASHVTTMAGLASFFILPPLSLLLLPAGFIMGMIAWRSKKRYERKRGRGLALASVAIGGGFTVMIAISLVAFFLTFGVF